jgi:hypothetical protein
MFEIIKSWFQKPREPTQEEKTTELIRKLKNTDYAFVYSSDLALISLSVVKKNISDYLNYLRRINRKLSTGEEIYLRSLTTEHFQIRLPDWFTVNGMFTKPSEQMILFLEEVEIFMDLYKKHDRMLNRTYNQEHNFKAVGSVCGDLLTLMKDIQNVHSQSLQSGSEQTD